MNKSLLTYLSLIFIAGAVHASDDQQTIDAAPVEVPEVCVAPTGTPIIPDGNVASKDELLAAQSAVKFFQSTNLDYLRCLDVKRAAVAPDTEEAAEQLAELEKLERAAIAMEEKVASEFNTARKFFLER